jgi:FkbM family methyltransferase
LGRFGRSVILDIAYPLCHLFRTNWFMKRMPHEKMVAKELKKIRGSLFVDVGANLGFYTVILSENFKEVISIEPYLKDYRLLIKNVKSIAHNVRFVKQAVSNTEGSCAFSEGRQLATVGEGNNESGIVVPTTTLDSLLDRYDIVDLIKVDVEGAEWLVLDGAKKTISKVKSWMIESHNPARNKDLENWFETRGYKSKWLDVNHIFAWRDRN